GSNPEASATRRTVLNIEPLLSCKPFQASPAIRDRGCPDPGQCRILDRSRRRRHRRRWYRHGGSGRCDPCSPCGLDLELFLESRLEPLLPFVPPMNTVCVFQPKLAPTVLERVSAVLCTHDGCRQF